jgi:hypothetical protein
MFKTIRLWAWGHTRPGNLILVWYNGLIYGIEFDIKDNILMNPEEMGERPN